MRKKLSILTQQAFTLVEMAVAITVFGVALSIFVTSQTKQIDNFIYEKNLFRATLAAQYLMAIFQTQDPPPDDLQEEGSLEDTLRQKGYFSGDDINGQENLFSGWKYSETITPVEDLSSTSLQNSIRKLELKVSWTEDPRDNITLSYFFNVPIKTTE